jgi:hypothetical protein
MNEPKPPPLLTPLMQFLRDVQRSYVWYRDNVGNPDYDPPLPKLVKQGPNNFIVTEHGERYKRALLRKNGIVTVGRPRKDGPPPHETSPPGKIPAE